MDSTWIRPLDDLGGRDVTWAGGKGASLGELRLTGARVPDAFVVGRNAFDHFMEIADPDGVVDRTLDALGAGQIEPAMASERILAQLDPAPLPTEVRVAIAEATTALGAPRVSVRSSATCEDGASTAWAGQLDTVLNVEAAAVPEQVKRCWLSIFRPAPLAYGVAHGELTAGFGVAAVVQQMIASEVSGIGFSVHPVTQEPELQLLEACLGLGEAIVSGEISPDQYVVREPGEIVERAIGAQKKALILDPGAPRPEWRPLDAARGERQKLSDARVLEYAELLARIEAHYGRPIDTEWALTDAGFHLLQARPITTLAKEYRDSIVDTAEPWQLMVRRPMTLLEVSVLAHWIDSAHAGADFGLHCDRYLAIQDTADMASSFLAERSMSGGLDHVLDLDRNDRGRLIGFLEQGHEAMAEGVARMERGEGFDDIDEAAEYLIRIGRFTVALPAWTLIALDLGHVDDPRVQELAEGLRARSIYPRVAHELVSPLAAKCAKQLGFEHPERASELCTWREVSRATLDLATLRSRAAKVDAGERFVFQVLEDQESVRFVSETGYLLMRQAGQRQIVAPDDPDLIAGQAAWPGVHRGRARVVMSSNPEGYTLEDGEVLVSIQSNPNLMPLLRHAGAIVTDDGGVACHAGIICRELKIPTVIGTERATSAIRTGDLVEVDATSQVVRVLERAS